MELAVVVETDLLGQSYTKEICELFRKAFSQVGNQQVWNPVNGSAKKPSEMEQREEWHQREYRSPVRRKKFEKKKSDYFWHSAERGLKVAVVRRLAPMWIPLFCKCHLFVLFFFFFFFFSIYLIKRSTCYLSVEFCFCVRGTYLCTLSPFTLRQNGQEKSISIHSSNVLIWQRNNKVNKSNYV